MLVLNMLRSGLAILLCFGSSSWGAEPSESQPLYRALENTPTGNVVSSDGTCQVKNETGLCMKTWQCMHQGGHHAGLCPHKHIFGTCCLISKNMSTEKTTPKELDTIISEASATYEVLQKLLASLFTPTQVTEETEQPNDQELPEQDQRNGTRKKNKLIAIDPLRTGEDCGVIKVSLPQGRIVNGTDATFGEFPWQVSIRVMTTGGHYAHYCGGTLISKSWIATAAHCIRSISSLERIKVRIGEHDLSEENEKFPYVERIVKRNFTHPKFHFLTFKYDIALLELYEPVPEQPNIGSICLPGSDNSLHGLEAWATGWGRLYDEGPTPDVLQKVPLKIMKNKECKKTFQNAGRFERIPKIFLCASEAGRDACTGDSGGPLQVKDSSGRWFLGGIVSWGIGCAKPNHPGVYTRISKFMPFIKKTIFKNS